MKCLRYLLERHRAYSLDATGNFIDQKDGFIDNDLHQNVYHYVAIRDQKAGHDAANILKEYPSILTCINVNEPDINGLTPLLTAMKRNNVTVAQLLVQSGARFDEIINGQYPIHIAVTNGQVEVLEEMIKATGKPANKT